jgi:putative peptidoglycan lipid II flippase
VLRSRNADAVREQKAPGSRGLADRSLVRTFAEIAPATFLGQVASFAFSIALARVLGSSAETDAYFLAYSVQGAVFLVMRVGLQAAMPGITERHAESEEEFAHASSQLVSSVVVVTTAVGAAVTAAAVVVVPFVLPHASGDLVSLVRQDLVALAPLPVLGSLTGALQAIQTVRGHVTSTVTVTALGPLVKTIAVLTLGRSLATQSLIIGQLLGSALVVLVLGWMIRAGGVDLRPVATVLPPFVRGVIRLSVPLIIGESVVQANPIVDNAMASPLGPGTVTQFELGTRLFWAGAVLLAGGLIAPLTGTWSARLLHDGWEAVRASVIRTTKTVFAILPPVVALGVALRHQAVDLLYGGGAYSAEALRVTGNVLGMLVLGLPANVLFVAFVSLFVIRRATVLPMLVAMSNVVLNVVLNLALRPVLGAPGLALSTSITTTILVLVYAHSATRRWDLRLREAAGSLVRSLLATGALCAVAFAVTALPWRTGIPARLAEIAAVIAVVLIVHAAILLGTRDPLALRTLDVLRARLGRAAATASR